MTAYYEDWSTKDRVVKPWVYKWCGRDKNCMNTHHEARMRDKKDVDREGEMIITNETKIVIPSCSSDKDISAESKCRIMNFISLRFQIK